MDSYAARLASFNAAHSTAKKVTKPIKWPLTTPSPPQLARAGFFYQPSSTCLDNVTCYLCQSNLDGWEEDDDPIEEHIKLAPDCGWANIIVIEQRIEEGHRDFEDFDHEKLFNARLMTFESRWPHENKRGWLCKISKMVEAGWHHCPTPESDDYARCAYCNLGLDGWEPKDNPYDEHLRRSPDCFFFSNKTASKPTKSKRSRKNGPSKASRVSTQSMVSNLSESVSMAEGDLNEGSHLSTAEVPQTLKGSKGKKVPKSKKKPTRSKVKTRMTKNDEEQMPSSFIEPEDDDFEVKVTRSTEKGLGKKRSSDEIAGLTSLADITAVDAEDEAPKPAVKKRRTTRASNKANVDMSALPAVDDIDKADDDDDGLDVSMTDVQEEHLHAKSKGKKQTKMTKKKGSLANRKNSEISAEPNASQSIGLVNNDDIDAVLKEDLERPLTDDGGEEDVPKVKNPKGRRTTRKTSTIDAAERATRTRTRANTVTNSDSAEVIYPDMAAVDSAPENQSIPAQILHSVQPKPRRQASQKASAKEKKSETTSNGTTELSVDTLPEKLESTIVKPRGRVISKKIRPDQAQYPEIQAPHLDLETNGEFDVSIDAKEVAEESGHETDVSVAGGTNTKRGKKGTATKTKKGAKKIGPKSQNIEDVIQSTTAQHPTDTVERENVEARSERLAPPIEVPDAAMKSSKVPKPRMKATKVEKEAPKASPYVEESTLAISVEQLPDFISTLSPPIASGHSTPAHVPSPQSSDAENQPPSSRPSQSRPPLVVVSPSRQTGRRISLANVTPTASPSKGNIPRLQSALPWSAVDIDLIFHGTPGTDVENIDLANGLPGTKVLTSPEKRYTVEQWIKTNAEKAEDRLRNDCERLVGKFEEEGMRALRTLEGLVCSD